MGQLTAGIPRSPFFQSAAQKSRSLAMARTSWSGSPAPSIVTRTGALLGETTMLSRVHRGSCGRATWPSFQPQLYSTVWPGCVSSCWSGFFLLNETPSRSPWLRQPEQQTRLERSRRTASTQVWASEVPTQPDTCQLDSYGKTEIKQCLIFYLQIRAIVHHLFLETKNLL